MGRIAKVLGSSSHRDPVPPGFVVEDALDLGRESAQVFRGLRHAPRRGQDGLRPESGPAALSVARAARMKERGQGRGRSEERSGSIRGRLGVARRPLHNVIERLDRRGRR
jgi:hypothetical protein